MRTISRRVLAIAFAAALLAAACGNDDDDAATTTTTAPTAPANGDMDGDMDETGDIVDVAIAAGDFTTLVTAVQAAGLEDTLRGDGPFTVFAPTDAAFAALPEGALDELLADPDGLSAVLTYHVVAGEFYASDVVGLSSVTTVNGAELSITVEGDEVRVGDAVVIATDIEASNGVIHVIDAVLLP